MKEIPKQKLRYESTWKRTLAQKDLDEIESLFQSLSEPSLGTVQFIPFRVAYNHRGDLLATVLIQNATNEHFELKHCPIRFEDAEGFVVQENFYSDKLRVEAYCTTPWTFIFPKQSIQREAINVAKWSLAVDSD